MGNTIVALATPPLKGALALIRVSGENAFPITSRLSSKSLVGLTDRKMVYAYLKDGEDVIDQVMIFAYPSSKSMTGEDVVEITCHGSMLIANEIISAYIANGARYAERGEFTSRAFLNGKMDLIEAEAVNELINATSKEAKNLSMMSLEGKTSKLLEPIRTLLANELALIEVNIDYPEYEDLEEATKEKISEDIDVIRKELSKLIEGGEQGKIIKDGIKVAIVGAPNAGKSSLLNALLEENKAIVSSIPGTTRDIVEGEINLGGIPFRLLDTAGIRESDNEIEAIGINKSKEAIEKADLVVLVVDSSIGLTEEDEEIKELSKGKKLIIAYNKNDLDNHLEGLSISAKLGDIEPLKKEMIKQSGIGGKEAFESPSLSNARQLGVLRQIDSILLETKESIKDDLSLDLASAGIQRCYNLTRELLGEGATLDYTDEIFSRFCVGK